MAVQSAPARKRVRERFTESDPGYPLGKGYPPGRTLRQDGESHRQWWMRVLRDDLCAYCATIAPAQTVDHIEPRSRKARGIGGAHCWLNYTGACPSCNTGKRDLALLDYLHRRHAATGRRAA